MTLDVFQAAFSVTQLVLALGASFFAFGLGKTFRGGIFEEAWRVIAAAPVIYAAAQAISLFEALSQRTPAVEALESAVTVAFLLLLLAGLFMFASAWSRRPREEGGNYAKRATGALVYFMGRTGASTVLVYTGEPKPEDFAVKLGKVLGSGASDFIKRTLNEEPEAKEGKE